MFKRPARILLVATDTRIVLAARRATADDDPQLETRVTQIPSQADLAWADLAATLDEAAADRLPPSPACRHRPWPLDAAECASPDEIEAAIAERLRSMRGGLRLLDRLNGEDRP